MKRVHFIDNGLKVALILLCGLFCSKAPQPFSGGIITFSAGEVYINNIKAIPGSEVKSGDTITTSAKSSAVIQISETGIIALKENTTLKVELLTVSEGKTNLDTALDRGYIFNKLMKQSGSYTVKSPAVTAAVRGTSFSVSADDKGNSDVKLLSGSVEIAHKTSGRSLVLGERETVSASTESIATTEKLTETDELKMMLLDSIKALPAEKIHELKKSEKAVEEIVPATAIPVITEADEIKEDKSSPGITLADIEKRYGALSRVKLSSGKEYIGSFRQAGDKIEIITVKGKVKVPAASVSGVEPYKK
ncbi:MAG TPA: FecR family protein [Spirochaetota bacterium]|nr:FecR family protein [Spirochaetota bacterium]